MAAGDASVAVRARAVRLALAPRPQAPFLAALPATAALPVTTALPATAALPVPARTGMRLARTSFALGTRICRTPSWAEASMASAITWLGRVIDRRNAP